MGQKMSNAPIYFALAQVRFNTILALEQFLPAIQDVLRKAGYPGFERRIVGLINVSIGASASLGAPVPLMQPQAQFIFTNEDQTSGFVLDQAMIIFHTTKYDTFETFSEEFIKGLKALHESASLDYSERVGIRYLDAVLPKQSETIKEFLVPSVIGIYDKLLPRQLMHSISETRTKKGNTTLMSRSTIMDQEVSGSAAFPHDLQPVSLNILNKFNAIKGLYAVIDTDCWLEERERFSLDAVSKRLLTLHNELCRSFDMTVTTYALQAWE